MIPYGPYDLVVYNSSIGRSGAHLMRFCFYLFLTLQNQWKWLEMEPGGFEPLPEVKKRLKKNFPQMCALYYSQCSIVGGEHENLSCSLSAIT